MIMRLNWQYNVIKSSSSEKRDDNDHAYVYNRRGSPFSKHLNISSDPVNNNRNKLAKERESADDIIHRNEHGLVCRT
jgi:hypothetical protein